MKIVFQNREYKSLSECYKENEGIIKVSQATARKRIKSGTPIDDALLNPNKKTFQSVRRHIVEGIEYSNLPSIAKAYSMTTDAVYKRYSRGFRGDDLVPFGKRKYSSPQQKKTKPLTTEIIVDGKRYKSAMQACTELGVKYSTYRKRLARELSNEQALGITPVEDRRFRIKKEVVVDEEVVGLDETNNDKAIKRPQLKRHSKGEETKKIELNAFGKSYKSYKKLAQAFSLPYHLVYQRITIYGYTPEEAVKADGKANKVIVEGKEYKSKAKAAEAYDITLPILLSRMYKGLTIEQALGIEAYDTAYSITYEDQKYRNLEHLAITKDISVKALRSRLSSGRTLEQALNSGKRIYNKGRINRKLLERDPERAQSKALLYFVRLKDGNYKIGITTKSVKRRLKYKGLLYETIVTVNDTLLKVFDLEQIILALFKDKRANISAESLDGYTEVMELTDEDANLITSLLLEYVIKKNVLV